MKRTLLVAAAIVLTGASWVDPHAKAREASVWYDKGDFAAATQKYNEALTDDPDSFLLQYNRGASLYRENKFDEAATAFGRAPAMTARQSVGAVEIAELAYNFGNAKYRQGAAVAESDPQTALGLYAEALAAYRRAMGADPGDVDAKFNHELVEKKIEALRKKLEEQQEQQQEQEQQQQQQQQSDPQSQEEQDQQQRAEQQQDQQQQDGQQGQQPESETQEAAEQQDRETAEEQAQQGEPQPEDAAQQRQESAPQQAGADGESSQQQPPAQPTVSGERREGEMSEREAQALLDAARDQEVSPEEIIERMQGRAVLEPSQDW